MNLSKPVPVGIDCTGRIITGIPMNPLTKKYKPLLRRALAIELVLELGGTAGQFKKLAAGKKLAATSAGGTRMFYKRDAIIELFT